MYSVLSEFTWKPVVSILFYGYPTSTLTKRISKKLDGNCTRMLRAILNKSWKQHPTKQHLNSHLPPISKTTQRKRTRHTRYCWRSKGEDISDVLLRTPSHRRASVGRPTTNYRQQMIERNGERVSGKSVPAARHDDDDDFLINYVLSSNFNNYYHLLPTH